MQPLGYNNCTYFIQNATFASAKFRFLRITDFNIENDRFTDADVGWHLKKIGIECWRNIWSVCCAFFHFHEEFEATFLLIKKKKIKTFNGFYPPSDKPLQMVEPPTHVTDGGATYSC